MDLDKFEGLLKPWTKPSLLSQGHYQGLSLAQKPEGKRMSSNCKTVVDIAEQHAHSIIYTENRVKHSNYHNVYQTTRWT